MHPNSKVNNNQLPAQVSSSSRPVMKLLSNNVMSNRDVSARFLSKQNHNINNSNHHILKESKLTRNLKSASMIMLDIQSNSNNMNGSPGGSGASASPRSSSSSGASSSSFDDDLDAMDSNESVPSDSNDSNEELEYGPGIVAKLTNKFLKYSLKTAASSETGLIRRTQFRSHHNLTHCSSLENLLNSPPSSLNASSSDHHHSSSHSTSNNNSSGEEEESSPENRGNNHRALHAHPPPPSKTSALLESSLKSHLQHQNKYPVSNIRSISSHENNGSFPESPSSRSKNNDNQQLHHQNRNDAEDSAGVVVPVDNHHDEEEKGKKNPEGHDPALDLARHANEGKSSDTAGEPKVNCKKDQEDDNTISGESLQDNKIQVCHGDLVESSGNEATQPIIAGDDIRCSDKNRITKETSTTLSNLQGSDDNLFSSRGCKQQLEVKDEEGNSLDGEAKKPVIKNLHLKSASSSCLSVSALTLTSSSASNLFLNKTPKSVIPSSRIETINSRDSHINRVTQQKHGDDGRDDNDRDGKSCATTTFKPNNISQQPSQHHHLPAVTSSGSNNSAVTAPKGQYIKNTSSTALTPRSHQYHVGPLSSLTPVIKKSQSMDSLLFDASFTPSTQTVFSPEKKKTSSVMKPLARPLPPPPPPPTSRRTTSSTSSSLPPTHKPPVLPLSFTSRQKESEQHVDEPRKKIPKDETIQSHTSTPTPSPRVTAVVTPMKNPQVKQPQQPVPALPARNQNRQVNPEISATVPSVPPPSLPTSSSVPRLPVRNNRAVKATSSVQTSSVIPATRSSSLVVKDGVDDAELTQRSSFSFPGSQVIDAVVTDKSESFPSSTETSVSASSLGLTTTKARPRPLTRGSTLPAVKPVIAQKPKGFQVNSVEVVKDNDQGISSQLLSHSLQQSSSGIQKSLNQSHEDSNETSYPSVKDINIIQYQQQEPVADSAETKPVSTFASQTLKNHQDVSPDSVASEREGGEEKKSEVKLSASEGLYLSSRKCHSNSTESASEETPSTTTTKTTCSSGGRSTAFSTSFTDFVSQLHSDSCNTSFNSNSSNNLDYNYQSFTSQVTRDQNVEKVVGEKGVQETRDKGLEAGCGFTPPTSYPSSKSLLVTHDDEDGDFDSQDTVSDSFAFEGKEREEGLDVTSLSFNDKEEKARREIHLQKQLEEKPGKQTSESTPEVKDNKDNSLHHQHLGDSIPIKATSCESIVLNKSPSDIITPVGVNQRGFIEGVRHQSPAVSVADQEADVSFLEVTELIPTTTSTEDQESIMISPKTLRELPKADIVKNVRKIFESNSSPSSNSVSSSVSSSLVKNSTSNDHLRAVSSSESMGNISSSCLTTKRKEEECGEERVPHVTSFSSLSNPGLVSSSSSSSSSSSCIRQDNTTSTMTVTSASFSSSIASNMTGNNLSKKGNHDSTMMMPTTSSSALTSLSSTLTSSPLNPSSSSSSCVTKDSFSSTKASSTSSSSSDKCLLTSKKDESLHVINTSKENIISSKPVASGKQNTASSPVSPAKNASTANNISSQELRSKKGKQEEEQKESLSKEETTSTRTSLSQRELSVTVKSSPVAKNDDDASGDTKYYQENKKIPTPSPPARSLGNGNSSGTTSSIVATAIKSNSKVVPVPPLPSTRSNFPINHTDKNRTTLISLVNGSQSNGNANNNNIHASDNNSQQQQTKAVRKSNQPNNSMVFDFRGKNVQPTLAITSPYGRSAVISTNDENDVGEDYRGSTEVPEPCGVSFIGENEIVGKGILLKKRNKKLSISFCPEDKLTAVFEYPSESCLLKFFEEESQRQEMTSVSGQDKEDDSQSKIHDQSKESMQEITLKSSIQSSITLRGSTSGLASYKPTFLANQEVSAFELGVSNSSSTSSSSGQMIHHRRQQHPSRFIDNNQVLHHNQQQLNQVVNLKNQQNNPFHRSPSSAMNGGNNTNKNNGNLIRNDLGFLVSPGMLLNNHLHPENDCVIDADVALIKPADCHETTSWSTSSHASDLLF